MNTKLDKLCEMEIVLNATIIRIDEFEKKFCDMDKNVESLWEELNDVKKQIADNTNSVVSGDRRQVSMERPNRKHLGQNGRCRP